MKFINCLAHKPEIFQLLGFLRRTSSPLWVCPSSDTSRIYICFPWITLSSACATGTAWERAGAAEVVWQEGRVENRVRWGEGHRRTGNVWPLNSSPPPSLCIVVRLLTSGEFEETNFTLLNPLDGKCLFWLDPISKKTVRLVKIIYLKCIFYLRVGSK